MKFRARLFLLVASCNLVGFARAAEPPSAPILRIEAGMHTAPISHISADVSGRLVLTVSQDKTARLWELPGNRLLRVLRPPLSEGDEGKLYAGALSPDGTLAAVGGYCSHDEKDESIYLFETGTGRLVRRISGLTDVTRDLSFALHGRFLAAVGQGLRVWETATGREVGRDSDYSGRDSYSVDWYGEEHLVTTCLDGSLRLYRLRASFDGGELTLLRKSAVKGGTQPCDARFTPDGRRIAIGFSDPHVVTIVDGSDLSFDYAPDCAGVGVGSLDAVAWTDDGATLVAGGRWVLNGASRVRRWAGAGRSRPQDTVVSKDTLTDLRPLPGGGILFATADPAWGVLGVSGTRQIFGAPPIADYRGLFAGFRLSSDGSTVAFGYERLAKLPAHFSLSRLELTLLKGAPSASGLHAPRVEGLKVTDWFGNTSPKLAGKPLSIFPDETSFSRAISRDASSFLLGTSYRLRDFTAEGRERWQAPAPDIAWAVNLADNDRLAVAAYGDGTIRWHRADTGQELLAFFPHADRKRWVLWTPQGYYDCSPGAEEVIGWHVNRGKDQAADFFPAAKFRDQFYRPDVISRVLETRDVAVALKAANAAAGRKTQPAPRIEDVVAKMQPPVVELAVGGARGEATVTDGATTFTVRYRVRRAGGEVVSRVRLLVDGRPVEIDAPIPASDTAEVTASVVLPARDCVVGVLAANRFAVSEPALLRIVRGGAPALPAVASQPPPLKPKLYLLAAGISTYENNDQLENLHYAAKDAQDFATAFHRQEGGLYQKVEAKVLTDKDATAGNIQDGLEWIKRETTSKDLAIVFLSGHGENDEEQHYYFCPHDYDQTHRLRTGVSDQQIENTVRSIPGKLLFFIDSCHAGNALGKLFAAKGGLSGLDVTRMVNELSAAENGAIVFTSSTGRQLSLELSDEKNGAFTKAIVEGLDGRADLLHKGIVTVSSLETFVAERVKELTKGQQSPTVAKPQTVPDFPIALKR